MIVLLSKINKIEIMDHVKQKETLNKNNLKLMNLTK